MTKNIYLAIALLAIWIPAAPAATVSFVAPSTVSGSSFDIIVQAADLFAGRDTATDILISYGFNVSIANPSVFAFTGVDSGPLFDPATTEPGTDVFGSAFGQNGFGVEPGAAEPLKLATLHFSVLGPGTSNIVISSDLSNLFQGLQYLNEPFQESIGAVLPVTATAAVPEPRITLLQGIILIGIMLLRRPRHKQPPAHTGCCRYDF